MICNMKIHKTKFAVFIAVVVSTISMMSFDVLNDTGQAGRTASPGETTCNGCHTGFALNDGMGSVTITSPDLSNWEYMTGDTYTINITVARMGAPLFGFGTECLTMDAIPQNAGILQVTNTAETQILNATVNTVVRKNMTHKLNGGLGTDTKTFSFRWIAPTTNVGNVTFYAAGNATNGNGAKTGDHIYTTTQLVTPAIGAGSQEEVIASADFTMFPNPANENIFVSYSAPVGDEVIFSLMSVDGKVVTNDFTFQGTGSTATSTIELPSDLSSGIYLLKMVNGEKVNVRRIVIQ